VLRTPKLLAENRIILDHPNGFEAITICGFNDFKMTQKIAIDPARFESIRGRRHRGIGNCYFGVIYVDADVR